MKAFFKFNMGNMGLNKFESESMYIYHLNRKYAELEMTNFICFSVCKTKLIQAKQNYFEHYNLFFINYQDKNSSENIYYKNIIYCFESENKL